MILFFTEDVDCKVISINSTVSTNITPNTSCVISFSKLVSPPFDVSDPCREFNAIISASGGSYLISKFVSILKK